MTKMGRPVVMTAEERRKEIFIAAEQCFGDKGFEHVTMSEIATQAGMSKKTLYVYFADKRELLESLVSSSYIWSADAFDEQGLNAKALLKRHLTTVAEHVLSPRHLKLCRLAISERVSIAGITDTFYEMGISTSRNHLIAAVKKIPSAQYILQLDADVLADMLFGASIAKPFVDVLLIENGVDLPTIYQRIETTIDALFKDEPN